MSPSQSTGYHHGNLRTALIDAATELLGREGNAALTLRAAARVAGVSQAAPYKHFSDKRALLAAVAERGYTELHHRCELVAGTTREPHTRLQRLGEAYVRFALENPALFRLMFSAELGSMADHPGLAAAAARAHGLMEDAVRQLVPPSTLETACAGTWSVVHGLACLLLEGRIRLPTGGESQLIHQVTASFVDGLMPDA
ncbi:MAG: TetR/AcrR family transcriptional regulator [Ectothiorhodospiraceae bacterium]|nr:TetR/AcrR family transcriptional regulator [Ectothiorhodospiraceae bacterium]MCH8505003.1 TetR/AcrR family transcriptional regulator [Ectothiorhodospiraceae bacterium]